ncbi:MAG: HET domain-containing protein [Gallionella sp.]|nr:HET domain-containing protein [Gallionella sp.]MCK9354736.1 HET domain-containing protein [Gallionella sp.]
MNNTTKAPENFFRLLVPATNLTPPDRPSIELCGSRWFFTEWMSITEAPPYTCISYSWGSGKVDDMFEDGQLMSYRTIPSLEATIKATQTPEHWSYALMSSSRDAQKEAAAVEAAIKAAQAIWIDALCVPANEPTRSACLRNMGAIYSSAAQVFAVLSEPCARLLLQIKATGHMNPEEFFILENDDWITRAWTYQEMANSKSTFFIARGDGSVLHLALDFLNAILTDTTDYADAQGFARTELAVRFPRLDSLQVMMAEHRIAEYTGRCAYQVMSAMHQRYAEREEDRIYAMIGAITDSQSNNLNDEILSPAEYFMRVCEAKGDYSFIYCIAPRSDQSGRRWRPAAEKIAPVLSGVLIGGSGQTGSLKPTYLQLENMCRLAPNSVNSDGIKSTRTFLQSDSTNLSPTDIATAIFERLKQKGFSGCGDYVELESGFFFPQSRFTHSNDIFVAVSPDMNWTNGAAGLLLSSNGTDINEFCDVGVFIGRLPKVGESINVR